MRIHFVKPLRIIMLILIMLVTISLTIYIYLGFTNRFPSKEVYLAEILFPVLIAPIITLLILNLEILKNNKPIHKITIVNWFAKVTTEPLFNCLFRGHDKIGYLRAVVLASNLRFIDSEDLKKIFF